MASSPSTACPDVNASHAEHPPSYSASAAPLPTVKPSQQATQPKEKAMNGTYNTPRTGMFDSILAGAMLLASFLVIVGNVIVPAIA